MAHSHVTSHSSVPPKLVSPASVQRKCARCEQEEEETIRRFPKDGAKAATEPAGEQPSSAETAPETSSTEQTPSPSEETPTEPATEDKAGATLLVDDDAEKVAPGQMRKTDFLDSLRESVCAAANEAMASTGQTTENCPWMDYWFTDMAGKDAAHVEKALRKFAPETAAAATAQDYIPLVTARVRRSVEQWAKTGEISGLPEGITPDIPGLGVMGALAGGLGGMFFKAKAGGPRAVSDVQAIRHQLGAGRPLPGDARSRMESAFGLSFSQVRIHIDSPAASLSDQLNARAFTVGEHVAFGPGEYRPGTLVGDALLAHELAHVVQQGGAQAQGPLAKGEGQYNAFEEDADVAAIAAVGSVWQNAKDGFKSINRRTLPSLRSGLGLQRCPPTPKTAPSVLPSTLPSSTPPTGSSGPAFGRILEEYGSAWCDPDQGKMTWQVRTDKIPLCMADCYKTHELSHVEFGKDECAKVSAIYQELQKATDEADRAVAEAKNAPSDAAMSKAEAAAKKLADITNKFQAAVEAYEKWNKQSCAENEGRAYQAGIDACKDARVQKQCADMKDSKRYTDVMKEWEEFKKNPPNCH